MSARSRELSIVLLVVFAVGCKDDATSTPSNDSTDTVSSETAVPSIVSTDTARPTDTAAANDTPSTTDSHVGTDTVTDTGSALASCVGLRCNTPPGNVCGSAVNLAVYNQVGWCESGECHYAFRQETCEIGSCTDGICASAPCQGVTCDAPPDAECVDADTLKVYAPSGHCAAESGAPECRYASRSVTCQGGCVNGQCLDDPCAYVTCDDPPARYCDGSVLVTWESVPKCENGECLYQEKRTDCGALGCKDGRCAMDDPCANITCDQPPAAYCQDAATLRVYKSNGACQEGACLFNYDEIPCANGCANGQCTDEPCAGIECVKGVLNRCRDNTTLLSWNGEAGTCIDGVCTYSATGTVCQGGCAEAQCTADPCAGVTCNHPPADYCAGVGVAVVHENQGLCIGDGTCSFAGEEQTCADGCEQGECVEDAQDTTPVESDTGEDTGEGTSLETDTDNNGDTTPVDSDMGEDTSSEADTDTDTADNAGPTTDQIHIMPDENGWIDSGSNALGVQGGWVTSKGERATIQPDEGDALLDDGKLCFSGTAPRIVDQDDDGEPDWGTMWGASIGFSLCVEGQDDDLHVYPIGECPWSPNLDEKIVGVGFRFSPDSDVNAEEVRIQFVEGDTGAEMAYVSYSGTAISTGNVITAYFTDGEVFFDTSLKPEGVVPEQVRFMSLNIMANTSSSIDWDFCIEDAWLILDEPIPMIDTDLGVDTETETEVETDTASATDTATAERDTDIAIETDTETNTSCINHGLRIIADTEGWVDGCSNSVGVQGNWVAYADEHSTITPESRTVFFNAGDGVMCASGTTAQVPNDLSWDEYWGAGIAFHLCQSSPEDRSDQPDEFVNLTNCETNLSKVIGFRAKVTGTLPGEQLYAGFYETDNPSSSIPVTTLNSSVEYLFEDATVTWDPGAPALNPGGVCEFWFYVATKMDATVPFDFCVEDLELILAEDECSPDQGEQCGPDGNIRSVNSCGVTRALIQECPETTTCVNTSETTATCWDMGASADLLMSDASVILAGVLPSKVRLLRNAMQGDGDLGASLEEGFLVWEKNLTNFNPNGVPSSFTATGFSDQVTLRFAVSEYNQVVVGAVGPVPDVLSVIGTFIREPWENSWQDNWPDYLGSLKPTAIGLSGFLQRELVSLSDDTLVEGLVFNLDSLRKNSRFRIKHTLDEDITWLGYLLNISEGSETFDQGWESAQNELWCPFSDPTDDGTASRTLFIDYLDAVHSYVYGFSGCNNNEESWTYLDDVMFSHQEDWGERAEKAFDIYPEKITLSIDKTWSMTAAAVAITVLGGGIDVLDHTESPSEGHRINPPPDIIVFPSNTWVSN